MILTFAGGTGIVVNASQTRISGGRLTVCGLPCCRLSIFIYVAGAYLDWNSLVVLTPTMVSITDGFFLCGGHIQVSGSLLLSALN